MQTQYSLFAFSALGALVALAAQAASPLTVTVQGVGNGQPIPPKYAHCAANADEKSGNGEDVSPAVSWSKGPQGTKSYALIVVDPDVPVHRENAGQEGKTLPANAKRQNFYHWVLLNIPATTFAIPEGKGKEKEFGMQGINDYPTFMGLSIRPMEFAGYNGPCPPWNDERLHHYHFQVYALNVASLGLKNDFAPADAVKAIAAHTLAKGETIGTYTLNPTLKK